MKKKALNKALGVCVVSAALSGVGTGNVLAQETSIGIFDSPFDQCFADGYNISSVNKEQAFATAECFTTLLQRDANEVGASTITIMQYSASWYEAAALKGHEVAKAKFNTNLIALNALEKENHEMLHGDTSQLLASEKRFKALDIDNDGMLSVAEVSTSSLSDTFGKSDIDSDGMLSYGEYTIHSGEATAAGN